MSWIIVVVVRGLVRYLTVDRELEADRNGVGVRKFTNLAEAVAEARLVGGRVEPR